MAHIVIKNLSKTFGDKFVLSNLNLEIQDQDSLVIIGESGGGKTVFAKCLIGLEVPDIGSSVRIDDFEVGNKHIAQRGEMAKKFAMLFQSNALFDSLKIWQNICFQYLQSGDMSQQGMLGIAEKNLEMVGLNKSIMHLYPSEISGGMQKRVAIARSISANPEIIIFDEPTSGLDPVNAEKITNLIQKIHHNLKITVITITHDIRYLQTVATKIASIADGTIECCCDIKSIHKQKDAPFLKKFIAIAKDGILCG